MGVLTVLQIFILTSGLMTVQASAQQSEIERLRGFAEHQNQDKQFARDRLKGEKEFNEELETWDRQRQQDLVEHKKRQAQSAKPENGKDYKEDLQGRQDWVDDYEFNRKAYAKDRKKLDRKNFKDLVSEDDELGLRSARPRYALKSRALFGAPIKLGKSAALKAPSAAGTPSTGGGGNSNGSAPSFPPTPSFDDFNDGGFPPTTGMGEGFGDDIQLPPPPPPMPFDSGGDEIPPPPPPPPIFDEGFGGF